MPVTQYQSLESGKYPYTPVTFLYGPSSVAYFETGLGNFMAFTDTIDLPCRGKPNYHVFFITGNPGLIDYYRTFLKYLAENVIHITKGGENQTFNIFGQSLANFHSIGKEVTAYHERKRVIGLQDQIKFVETELNQYVRRVRDLNGQFNDDLSEKVKVILIGHSVGAYVCMEVLRRRREREKQLNPLQYEMDSSIIGFVGLWPTVTWIGRSPSGRIARVGQMRFAIAKG